MRHWSKLWWVKLLVVGPLFVSALQTTPTMSMARQVTQFESKVYHLCKQIPAGMVSTYGELAKALNTSPRAVGQAMKRNPFAPDVPCHRVIAANRELGGFFGERGIESEQVQRKLRLLKEEGVQFEHGDKVNQAAKVNQACLFSFADLAAPQEL